MSNKTTVITRRYRLADMRALWDFCQHDFERYLSLMEWLESLPAKAAWDQVRSAHAIQKIKVGKL